MVELRFKDHQRHLRRLRHAVLRAADPRRAVLSHLRMGSRSLWAGEDVLPIEPSSGVYLVALGKASVAMTQAALEVLGPRLKQGVAAVPKSAGRPALDPRIEAIPAGHPLPDEGSLAAGEASFRMLEKAQAPDWVIFLVSGGGSAMMEVPAVGLRFRDLLAVHRLLLPSGAPIEEINLVRQALSSLKAGGLARRAAPARSLALILSDVVGDRLSVIASGPTVLRSPNRAEARLLLEARGLWAQVPDAVKRTLAQPETPSPSAPRPMNLIIANNRHALEAAEASAAEMGFRVRIIHTGMRGEARILGQRFALRLARTGPRPACLLMGGESTVTVHGRGRGGRNQEFALAAALALNDDQALAIMALATDGIDGPTDAAGAVVSAGTASAMRSAGVEPQARLDQNDAYHALDAVDALLRTGPTGTNVNDVVVGLAYLR